ncbi:MAG: biotin--[acetyl-CoA-carboxylase] ligase [Candidatus Dormibacteraeota bacterium]|nr:biotin--[acetyl-CoA-carboxylase] ligase [Candidatus Dormibacteraeota bacterium]MBV9526244.1 biotin--[acetyl-CoA-carboxylase] ligase [Candidatus Dormibacteraeota bacterium]
MVKQRNFDVHHVQRTDSTQDEVRAAASRRAGDGWCCVAEEQTAGRGRLGRRWVAPPGTSLLASVLLRLPADRLEGVPFAGGLATLDALERTAGVHARLKWPNDVLAGGGKVAGLLAEVVSASGESPAAVALGLGVNLSVPEFPPGIAGVSLHTLAARPPSRDAVLDAWLDALGRRLAALEARGLAALLPDWRQAAAGLGAPVTVTTPSATISGLALDVAEDGALLVQTDAGVRRFLAGDVSLGGAAAWLS